MTFRPFPPVPSRGELLVYGLRGQSPSADSCQRLGLPVGQGGAAEIVLAGMEGSGTAPVAREVPVRCVAVADAVRALLRVPPEGFITGPGGRPALRPSDSLRCWAVAARLALRLVVGHAVAPVLVAGEDGSVTAAWRALANSDPEASEAMARLAAAMPPAAAAVALDEGRVWRPDALLGAFADAVADAAARGGAKPLRAGRPRARLLPWTARWAEALADPADAEVPLRDDAGELVAGVASWLSGDPPGGVPQLQLIAPDDDHAPWSLRFALRLDDGRLLPAEQVWDPPDDVDAIAVAETLLRGLGRCARIFPPLDRALRQPQPVQVDLDILEAWTFVSEIEPLLLGGDVVVTLPSDIAAHDVRLRLRVGTQAAAGDSAVEAAESAAAQTPVPQTVAYAWEVALGDEVLDEWELEALAGARSPLLRWRGRWVRVDPEVVGRLRALPPAGTVGLTEALVLSLGGSALLGDLPGWPQAPAGGDEPRLAAEQAERVEVVADGGVARLLERLEPTAQRPEVAATPEGFEGTLRPYQRSGVGWLLGMGELGFGAILADDMGLGKGIQLIAYLLHLSWERPTNGRSALSLIVCPTSVLGNWEREVRRFAPGLTVQRWHGAQRPDDLDGAPAVVLTTYGTLRRDVDLFAARTWDVVTLDEAQHVKNPHTAGARAVRRLDRRQLVALTGTPLENRLDELWALLDLANPGLLGGRTAFSRRFAVPIERRHDRHAAGQLRRLVAPFVLRRVKSDPAVISDLPAKIERSVSCSLTAEQVRLYAAAVDAALDDDDLRSASTMQRRGRVLALLTQLKQICDHPALTGGDRQPQLAGRSGKLAAAAEIVAAAVDGGERVLVFTQYVRMGHLLVAHLSDGLGVPVPFLHGGVPAAARDRLVEDFQRPVERPDDAGDSPPVLVISLRAGGTGLNLTAATHVVHYDRWWNPAVEDQATDRAHRIGQRRTVEVHKLVTAGTVEERIDDLLASKRMLADRVVGAGEAWITELADEELRALVELSAGAPVVDLDDDGNGWEEPARAGGGLLVPGDTP